MSDDTITCSSCQRPFQLGRSNICPHCGDPSKLPDDFDLAKRTAPFYIFNKRLEMFGDDDVQKRPRSVDRLVTQLFPRVGFAYRETPPDSTDKPPARRPAAKRKR